MRFLTSALVLASTASGSVDVRSVFAAQRIGMLAAALDKWLKNSVKLDERTGEASSVKQFVFTQGEVEFDGVLRSLIGDYQRAENLPADRPVTLSDLFKGMSADGDLEATIGKELVFLKDGAAGVRLSLHAIDPKSVTLGTGAVLIPSGYRSSGKDEEWIVRNSGDRCTYTFYNQEDGTEKAFMAQLGSMRHFSYDFDAVCLGDQTRWPQLIADLPPRTREIDGEATKVRLIKNIIDEPKLVIKCYYKNPRSFSPFRGSKIGEYTVSWEDSENLREPLGLIRDVGSDFSPNADQIVAKASYRGGPRFAYDKARAGWVCSAFEAAKRAYMKHVLAVPGKNRIPDNDNGPEDPLIKAFVDSIPRI
jgi:hypothetical protein